MLSGTETFSRNSRHVRFPQEPSRHVRRRVHIAASEKRRDVGIGIERAFWQRASDSRNRAQTFHHMIAQLDIFTPHLFVTFSGPGGASTSQMSPNIVPPNVTPELRSAFFAVAAQILLRPQPPREQDQSSSGIEGKYLVIKRLMPLFEQYAPRETAEAMRAQMEALATTMPDGVRQREACGEV